MEYELENSNLKKYLESEIENLKLQIEENKNRHYVNQTFIDEARDRINEYRDKEDSVFNLLSPIGVESVYKNKIAEELQKIDELNIENLNIISEIDDCKNKIIEIEKQLQIENTRENINVGVDNIDIEPTESDEVVIDDWESFINSILEALDDIDDCCYSNPKICKEKIVGLKNYVHDMCYGKGEWVSRET